MPLRKRLLETMRPGAHTVVMFPITPLAPFTAQQMTRRAVAGAHATGVFRKVPPKPGVRTSRIGRRGEVRST
jgi:hypothetical protein